MITDGISDSIFAEISPAYGVCSYEKLSGRLLPCRARKDIPVNCRSVFVFLFPYLLEKENYNNLKISKYAVGPDYHGIVVSKLGKACEKLAMLYPGESFVPFCDNSPFPEVSAAAAAGLGVRGRNGLLINRDFGSYVFIGEIASTLKCDEAEASGTDICISCGRCISACPGGALSESGLQKELCLSDITQRKGVLTAQQENLITGSGYYWGCDICQDVCPMNKNVRISPLKEFSENTVMNLSAEQMQGRAFAWRGEETIKRNLSLQNRDKE